MVFCVVILLDNGLQYLIEINRKTMLSAFLGIRSGLKAVIIDKVDTAFDLKISSEVGMRLPLFAGAGGKALMPMLQDEEIDRVLTETRLKAYTSKTITAEINSRLEAAAGPFAMATRQGESS